MAVQTPIPVRFEDVFPHGAHALDVSAVEDFGKPQGTDRLQRNKSMGMRTWQERVVDGDPDARNSQTELTVKIPAEVQPVPPDAMPGTPFRPVVFDNLTITPHVDERGARPRVAYSLRASAMHAAKPMPSAAKPAA